MEMVQISMLITDMPTKIDRLEQACNETDVAKIKAIAYSVRGTCITMRCSILADIAEKMANADKDNSFEKMEILLTELKQEWETVKNLLLHKMNH